MPVAHVNGTPLHYLDEGTGPALVLIHAFPVDSEMFRPQLDGLKGRFRVIAPDLRGFGKTPVTGPVTIDSFATDVADLLDLLKVERAVVGGVSMGGYVTLGMLRVAAHKVAGVVMMDTQAMADDDAARSKREENAQRISKEGLGFYVEAQVPKMIAKSSSPSLKGAVEAAMRRQSPEGAANALRAMAGRPDGRDMLARFGGKALVIVGEEDEVTPLAKAKQMAELVPGSTLLTVPHAAHFANWERPDEVNRALADFLGSL